MKKLLNYLNSPYPVFYQRWKIAVISSVIVFLILALLQPFGISSIEHHKLSILLGYMAVTAVFLCIPVYLFPALFPAYYEDDRWTVGKHILSQVYIFFFIAIGNWLYSAIVFNWGFRLDIFYSFLLCTVIIGFFPSVLFILLNRNRLLAFHLKEATEMNLHLQRSAATANVGRVEQEDTVILFAGGAKEVLEVNTSDLFFVEADGNYVKITYRKSHEPVRKLLRMTMKQAEEATAVYPFIIKCHRAFLVNLHAVSRVSGNSQGYRLSLDGCEEEIPVSRAYSKEIKTLIENMNEA